MFKKDLLFAKHFVLESEIGRGAYGVVWKAFDLKSDCFCAIKLAQNQDNHKREVDNLQLIRCKGEEIGIQRLLDNGFDHDHYYITLPILGMSLKEVFKKKHITSFSTKTVVQLGIQIISILEKIHSCGLIHGDIKMDNILLNSNDFNSPESSLVTLVDFGASSRFVGLNGSHKQSYKCTKFEGNIFTSSLYHMNGLRDSRRNDLISLFYLLLYLYEGSLPWNTKMSHEKIKAIFNEIKDQKKSFHLQILQQDIKNQNELHQLLKYAYALKYEDMPDYLYCQKLLLQFLDQQNDPIDWQMDWSYPSSQWNMKFTQKYASKFAKVIITSNLHQSDPFIKTNNQGASQTLKQISGIDFLGQSLLQSAAQFRSVNTYYDETENRRKQSVLPLLRIRVTKAKSDNIKATMGQQTLSNDENQRCPLIQPAEVIPSQILQKQEDIVMNPCQYAVDQSQLINSDDNCKQDDAFIQNIPQLSRKEHYIQSDGDIEKLIKYEKNCCYVTRLSKMRLLEEFKDDEEDLEDVIEDDEGTCIEVQNKIQSKILDCQHNNLALIQNRNNHQCL